MFFARSASFLVMSMPLRASTVIEVRPTACTVYASSEPSSSGFVR